MPRENYSELLALISVARERSFTRAAAKLGMSQSMLSHTIRKLEARLGVRLLTRTTRSVSVTQAGERLLRVVIPRFESIEAELKSVAELRDVPAGTIRITATDHAIDTLLWPKLCDVLPRYPQINVEISSDYALSDIVQARCDFGVRLGDELSNDTSAVRIGPDFRFVIVGAPSYFASHSIPGNPDDLVNHDCINLRLPTQGNLYAWELKCGNREINAKVRGRIVFNGIYQILNAALSGFGLAYIPEDLARPHLASGRLIPVLKAWWRRCHGYHLYYSNQRETTRAMQVLIESLLLAKRT
ncbi:transcriptional regulator, LysR family [Caballeronia arationis]|jgi:DNA-binding transcriptional LysR family regulator|uniref:Transcriptional regulator, LysR family n=1 Tax=Caballeronia arationis TaxID=1777142 RepID=A0A7Z7N071_9BURK|nr:LysR family transcriptional regulator [Caballeronia arationis]SOE46206.1 transcriptional regulator, LysR family [Caballeronia arationis]